MSPEYTKEQAVEVLKEISWLLELSQENRFKVIAFENAARILANHPSELKTLIDTGELEQLKGIGKGRIAAILRELCQNGRCSEHEELKKAFPETIFELFHVPGLGSKRIKQLYDTLGIKSLAELKKAAEGNKIAEIKAFGKKTQDNILQGIVGIENNSSEFIMSEALEEGERLLIYLKKQPGVQKVEIAGSLRRRKEVVHDIDLLAAAKSPTAVHQAFTQYPPVARILAQGDTKSSVVLKSGLQCDLRTVTVEEFPTALYYFTGSKEHNVATRTLAKKNNIKINEYGIFKGTKRLPIKDEAGIFKAIGLNYIPPEIRENTGEVEWAAEKEIPKLIEEKDIRGIFHVHTDYSDGRHTAAQMAEHAQKLGYEYIGFADHSQTAAYAGGLKPERLKEQWKEIDKVQKTLKIRIFKGIESDILADGRLDYPDDILKQFDFIVGSIHSSMRQSEEEMTTRVLRALDNKHLTILGHPTGRLLLRRPGYPLDFSKVFAAAHARGVVIEHNCNPHRLDLDANTLRQAKEHGLLISIGPDTHSTRELEYIRYGVGIARKAWLTQADVLNAMPLDRIEKFLV